MHDADDGSPERGEAEEAVIANLSMLLECPKRAAERATARSETTAHSWSMRVKSNWHSSKLHCRARGLQQA